MASSYKVLGQSAPSATSATNVYTVPSSTQAIISTIVVANRGAQATFRVSVRPAGESQANKHYLAYDVVIAANDSTTLTLGITMDETDVLTVYGSSANLSWNVFGTEITP
jgi:hypothetical protein